jgi:ATP-binding cassette subfamily A (ABC1) protein 3
MNNGQIICCGTPLFLKNYYGDGFKIKIFKNSQTFSMKNFDLMLKEHLKEYTIESNAAAELTVTYPLKNIQYLSEFFNELEKNKEFYSIESYSISSASIEEVFLK